MAKLINDNIIEWDQIGQHIEHAVERQVTAVYTDFTRIVQPFRNHIPFSSTTTVGKDILANIYPVGGIPLQQVGPGGANTADLWIFLDQGTSVVKVAYENIYIHATSPGTTHTQPRQGEVVFNPDASNDGIEPRRWTELVREEYSRLLPNAINRSIVDFFRR